MASLAPRLPAPRGTLTEWLSAVLHRRPGSGAVPEPVLGRWVDALDGDAATDEDLQLALHYVYGLSYRGFAGVDDAWEWDRDLLALRRLAESRFEHDLRASVADSGLVRGRPSVADVLRRGTGPSLSRHMAEEGTPREFAEFCIHRSAYQLKEADAHTWGIPRLTGARKSAYVEIQTDEYGSGRPGEAHAELFARVLEALDVDPRFGAHIDRLPATTLATDNLVSLLGSHRRLRAALLGHLAGFEMTSVDPMSRYSAAARRLDLPPDVRPGSRGISAGPGWCAP